jgi:ribosomal protein S18 acetylase RimI-like enzyme
MELRWIGPGDVDLLGAASALFDEPVRPAWARRFIEDAGHHLCLALLDGDPVGFVSGVEISHPDKGTEMLLYELGVDEEHRRRGIGSALTVALRDLARSRGCYGMWVLVDPDNSAALATYAASAPDESEPAVMLTWHLDPAGS